VAALSRVLKERRERLLVDLDLDADLAEVGGDRLGRLERRGVVSAGFWNVASSKENPSP